MNNDEVIDMFFPVVQANVLLPELKLHAADDFGPILALANVGIIDTRWSKNFTYGNVFLGGAHLARYILDNPETVKDKRVKDIGSGSAVVAIAAFFAGAQEVTAIDDDEIANLFMARNIRNNSASVKIIQENALCVSYEDADVITAADIFLDQALQFEHLLVEQAQNGKTVFAASGHFPVSKLSRYGTPLKPTDAAQRQYGNPDVFLRLG